MAGHSNINIKIDYKAKQAFSKYAKSQYMNMSSLCQKLIMEFLEENGLLEETKEEPTKKPKRTKVRKTKK